MTLTGHKISISLIGILLVVISGMPVSSRATDPGNYIGDTLSESRRDPIKLDDVIVKADRLSLTMMDIPAAASVIQISYADKSRYASAAEMIGSLPGFRTYPIGNDWGKTQVDVRGFYGGGQAEYLMVTYDGIPMNNIASGQVPWSIINFTDIGRLESISGPASAQYGDFGFGGMIALYSPYSPDKHSADLTFATGSNNAWELHSRLGIRTPSLSSSAAISKRRNDGWREHSSYEGENAHFALNRSLGDRARFSGGFTYGHSDEQYPGALTDVELAHDRSAASIENGKVHPDYARIDDYRVGFSGIIELADNIELKSLLSVSSTRTSEVVTVTLPVRHEPILISTGGEVSLGVQRTLWNRSLQFIIGFSGEYGELDSDYFTFDMTSSPSAIRNGDAYRRVVAGYVHGIFYPHEKLALSTGVRIDDIWSKYHSDNTAHSNEETAISPKIALSFNLGRGLNMYGSVAAAFKAPTLVHLYDSPPFYYEFEPGIGQYFNIANNGLQAQTGTCYEAGIKYLDTIQTSGRLTVFDYEISNEIDFDLSTNQYMNIGRSRHLGIELEASRRFFRSLSGELSLAYNASTFRAGEYYGNQINGVPHIEFNWQLTYNKPGYGYISVNGNGRSHQYLDQANQLKLGEYYLWGYSAGTVLWGIDFHAAICNIFDRTYIHDGYVGLWGESRFYPAQGRVVKLSLSRQF